MALRMEWEYKHFRIPKNFDDKMKIANLIRKMQQDGWTLVINDKTGVSVANLTKQDFDLLVFKKPIPKWS